MASEKLDFTSWYELQADTDSDDERVSPHSALPYSHASFSHRSIGGTRYQSLQPSSSTSSCQQSGHNNLIQQLLDEMDDANQKIDHYSGTGSRKSAGMSLEEYPIDSMSQSAKLREDSGCEEVVSTAIAEISKDFTSGNLLTGPLVSGESDESHLSSDNDFRHRRGAAYAKYPETAAGLSDNDWNPYVTESDTNTSPRLAGDFRPGSVFSGNSDSKINSLASSFNPPLCSTKGGSASRMLSKTASSSRPLPDSSLHLSDVKENPELSIRSIGSLKPDTSISPPQMSSSKLSEYSFEKNTDQPPSQNRENAAKNLKKCFERTSWPPSPEKSTVLGRLTERPVTGMSGSQLRTEGRTDYTGIEDRFSQLQNFGESKEKSSWEIQSSLPGRGYFSDAVQTALTSDMPFTSTSTDRFHSQSDAGIRESVRGKISKDVKASRDSEKSGQTRLSRESDTHTTTSGSSTDTVIPAAAFKRKEPASSQASHHDKLSQQVNQLLQETAHLTGSCRAKDRAPEKKPGSSATSLDYDRLHRDLQEIQDSLHTMGQPTASPCLTATIPPTTTTTTTATTAKSDSEDGDIVPSTSTTPERARRLMWDYGADLGYRSGQIDNLEGMMSDITSESSPLDARASKQDAVNYTSDGEETRASSVDHAEEEEHQEDLTLTSQLGQAAARQTAGGGGGGGDGTDLERLISTFRTETRALEDRYQAVRSQGMADKVISILTSTKPDQQAEGILSQIHAEEHELSLRRGGRPRLDGGRSGSSPISSFVGSMTEDPVRKRLDMSSLSDSNDSGRLLSSYLDSNPKLEAMFSATNAAQSLISAQMKKMADMTFNHSLEFSSPYRQEVQCYPVFSSQREQPQHQQLQQQLQEKRGEQQQGAQGQQRQGQTKAREAWMEKENPEMRKSPRETTAEKFESLMAEDNPKPSGAGEDSPSSGASPAESDKSSEMRRGKFRPYRPGGSQEVYYTESDTASVAESATTVESTHTGSDDAVAPYFPSSLLGSRHTGGGGEPGIYSGHSKTAGGPVGTAAETHLPTIQERSTSESLDRFSSEVSEQSAARGTDGGLRGQVSRIPMPAAGVGSGGVRPNPWDRATLGAEASSSSSSTISNIMARQQARVESIVREKDSARKLPTTEESQAKSIAKKTKGEELLEEAERTKALHARTASSPDNPHRSRIPVRGSPPDYQTALRSRSQDPEPGSSYLPQAEDNTDANRQSSFTDRLISSPEDTVSIIPDVVDSTSEEVRLLQAIDAEVETEILGPKPQGSSAENSDEGPAKPRQEQRSARDHEARSPRSDDDRYKTSVRETPEGYSRPAGSFAGGEDTAAPHKREPDRRRLEADLAVQQALGGLEVEEALGDKRQEEAEIARQQEQRRQLLMQAVQEQLRRDADLRKDSDLEPRALRNSGGADLRTSPEERDINTNRNVSFSESVEKRERLDQGEKEIDEAAADKRREEAELERRRLQARIARERELSQAMQLAREQEMQEAQARRHEVLAAAEAKREAALQQERNLRREVQKEQETAAKLRREAEELRQREEARREAEVRREAELLQRGAEIQHEADLHELELRKDADRLRERALHRAAEMRREAELTREAAQASEEALRKEVKLAREKAHTQQRDSYREAERQREAEEAIERAGGGRPNTDSEREASREVQQRGKKSSRKQEQDEAIDQQPLSHRVQVLREALEQETANQRPDLHILWERFVAGSDMAPEPDSSLNSDSVTMIADLLQDPTQHLVHTFLSERQKQHQEDQQRAAACRQADRQKREEDRLTVEEEQAALERELCRQQARRQQQRASSEEESNGSYGEILQQRERDRLKRREVRTQRKKTGKSPSSTSSIHKNSSGNADMEQAGGDTMETLYSIPEDMSQDLSPLKSRSPCRSQSQGRQADVIDPHMDKLRHRIVQQRHKISKERGKEAHREQKLDKLKALLSAKQSGLLDDQAIADHLAAISVTSAGSSDDTATLHSQLTALSDHTTTAKDSSTEMQRAKMPHSPAARLRLADRLAYHDMSVESEFTHLQEDSSLTETDYSGGDYHEARRTHSQSGRHFYHLSRNGGKSTKLHKMYSPYLRRELDHYRGTKDARKPASPFERSVHGRLRNVSTMYPTPKRSQRKPHHSSRVISRSVQTSPDFHKSQRRPRSFSPPYESMPPVPLPSMSPKGSPYRREAAVSFQGGDGAYRKPGSQRWPRQSRSISPAFDSSQVAACLSPDRSRPSSASPARSDQHRKRTPSPIRGRSPSPVEVRLKAWTERKSRSPLKDSRLHRQASPPAGLQERFSPPRRVKNYDFENGENRAPPIRRQRLVVKPPATSWFIPMNEDRPWRQPLKERQAHVMSRTERRPATLTHQQWRELARADLEGPDGGGLRGSVEGDAARMYLHRATKEAEVELTLQYDKFEEKPLCRMSLQEALMARRPNFVSALRQRQKRVKLAADNRQLQALVRAEQDRIFADQRCKSANPDAHPYSENLHQPRRRIFSKQEMKDMTEKIYKRLPEVKQMQVQKRRCEQYRMNRLKAKIFNMRVQRKVLERQQI